MESSSSSETDSSSSSISGYSTPPRSNLRSIALLSPKLLTSSELKRRFSPIHSPATKKRRCHLIRKPDSIVPFERPLHMPMILRTLFNPNQQQTSVVQSSNIDDSVVPGHCSSVLRFAKTESKNSLSISEGMMREKLKILLAKK